MLRSVIVTLLLGIQVAPGIGDASRTLTASSLSGPLGREGLFLREAGISRFLPTMSLFAFRIDSVDR